MCDNKKWLFSFYIFIFHYFVFHVIFAKQLPICTICIFRFSCCRGFLFLRFIIVVFDIFIVFPFCFYFISHYIYYTLILDITHFNSNKYYIFSIFLYQIPFIYFHHCSCITHYVRCSL